ELADNKNFKIDLKEKVLNGQPVYGECGGLMYLSKQVKDKDGNAYQMANLLDLEIEMTDKLQAMGYREIESLKNNLLLKAGQKAKGHLFHYSQVTKKSDKIPLNYKLDKRQEGYSYNDNLLASYLHINFASQPDVLRRFLKKAENYRSSVCKSKV
ncbi:MAG: cobyrinic acid a,c-diamide synthase, partial [Halarsenatibacteraceae bacterium]